MSRSQDPLSLDIVFFFLFMIFSISFITNVIKKILEMAGKTAGVKAGKKQPAPPPPDEPRRTRIEKERYELRYGFPMPPPRRTWVKPQPVIEAYTHEKVLQSVPRATGLEAETPAAAPDQTHAAGEPTKEETRLEQLLKDRDPLMQGIIMSVVLNRPRALRTRAPLRTL